MHLRQVDGPWIAVREGPKARTEKDMFDRPAYGRDGMRVRYGLPGGGVFLIAILGFALCAPLLHGAETKPMGRLLSFEVQRRDAQTGEASTETLKIDPAKCCIVVVDMWSYHWCSTWCGRTGAMIPRMNRTFEAARKLGMTVVFAPTECASTFAGTPHREIMAALPYHPTPEPAEVNLPDFGLPCGDMCGAPYPCQINYGHYGQDPRLVVADGDLVSSGPQELYNLCQERGITHLIYAGGATNMCLVGKPEGMVPMARLGMDCLIARKINEGYTEGESSEALDANTAACVAHIEKHLGASVSLEDEFRKAGLWDDEWIVDPVLIAPWGTDMRPTFFDGTLAITLSVPPVRLRGAEIRYTLDGSEPQGDSMLYTGPVTIEGTTTIRAAAFSGGERASLESEGHYAKLLPAPPLPDVHVSDLEPIKMNMNVWDQFSNQGRSVHPPRNDKSYGNRRLALRGVRYNKGIGLRAPSQMVYELKPEYKTFVARAGVDEGCLWMSGGRGRAAYPAAVFRVFIDGKVVAESPVMRISQEPWRFNVPVPEDSRVISLAAVTVGDGNREDTVQWVDAGFILK